MRGKDHGREKNQGRWPVVGSGRCRKVGANQKEG